MPITFSQDNTTQADNTINSSSFYSTIGTANIKLLSSSGIYNPSDNEIRIFNNSTDTITFKSDGKVGVGLTNPSERLTVNGNISTNGYYHGDGTNIVNLNWNNISLNKPTNFQSDWNSTIINKPTNFQSDWNTTIINKPTNFQSDWSTTIINKPTNFQSDWNTTIINKPTNFQSDWNTTIINKPTDYITSNVLTNINTNVDKKINTFISSNVLTNINTNVDNKINTFISSNVLTNINTNIDNKINTYISSNVLTNVLSNFTTNNTNSITSNVFSQIIAPYISSNVINNVVNNLSYLNSNVFVGSIERQYPPKAYNSASTETTTTFLGKTGVYYQTLTLDTTGISYGSGNYNIYSSSSLGSDTKELFFNFNTIEGGGHFGVSQYDLSTSYYKSGGTDCIISGYYGDWIIIQLPEAISLTKYSIFARYTSTDWFLRRAPALWKTYGSINGVNFYEITDASNDVNGLTSSYYINNNYQYTKTITAITPLYSYIGFCFNKVVGDSDGILNFNEIQLFGRVVPIPSSLPFGIVNSNVLTNINTNIDNKINTYISSNVLTNINTNIDNKNNTYISSNVLTNINTNIDNKINTYISSNVLTNVLTNYSTTNNNISSQWTTVTNLIYYNGGDVGIGTAIPSQKLDVNGNIQTTGLINCYRNITGLPTTGTYGGNGDRILLWVGYTTDQPYSLGVNDYTLWYSVPSSAKHSFFIGGSEKLSIISNGNVGIGSAIPSQKLDVNGNIKCTNFYGNGANITNINYNNIDNKPTNFQSDWNTTIINKPTNFQSDWNTTIINKPTNFQADWNSTIINKPSIVDSQWTSGSGLIYYGGYVGIGTASPITTLHISGTNASMILSSSLESQTTTLYLGTRYNHSSPYKVAIIAEGIASYSRAKLHFCLDNTEDNTSPQYDASVSNARMTITPAGNVGIGTTNPTQKLDINGTTKTSYLTVDNSITCGSLNPSSILYTNAITTSGNINAGNNDIFCGYINAKQAFTSDRTSVNTPQLGYGTGDRLILYQGSSTYHPYSLGINSSTLWYSVPSGAKHSFFIGGTEYLSINSTGSLGMKSGDTYIASFYNANLTEGIGIKGNGIYGIGSYSDDDITLQPKGNGSLYFRNNDIIKFSIRYNGNVGIGTYSSLFPLDIYGSSDASTGNYAIGIVGGNLVPLTVGTNSISLKCEYGIWTKTYFFFNCDERIKKNIVDINDDTALQKILSIQPKIYNYIDTIKRGSSNVYGFISQQVKEIIPEAVGIQKEIIPNIYDIGTYSNNIITTSNIDISNIINSSNIVKIYDENNKEYLCNVKSVLSSNSFTIDENINTSNVFIYGSEINDFHTLDKNYIYTLNVCATQEINRKLDLAIQRIEYLENYISSNINR